MSGALVRRRVAGLRRRSAWGVAFLIATGVPFLRAPVVEARLLLIVVDGLDAREVDDATTPILAKTWRASRWCPGTRSLASMPTRTNPNHATLLTGVHPAAHGITGNTSWDRKKGGARKLGAAADLLTETTFTVARRSASGMRTAAAVGKPKLAAMFAATNQQVAPDEIWDPRRTSDAARDEVTGYAYDATTLAAARALVEHASADFLFVNLADVDRVSHGTGPASSQATETRRRTDAALGTFLDWLASRDGWSSTTIIVTADHGFDSMTNPPLRFGDELSAAGLRSLVAVGDGGVGHVYVERGTDKARAKAQLATARRLATRQPGIAEAWYLDPNELDGGTRHTIAAAHPDWHVSQERVGDLLLIAQPGYQLVDGSAEEAKLIGNHGAPAEREVPVIVLGGAPMAAGDDCHDVTAADLGRTVQDCLGLREVRRLDGHAIAPEDRGRILRGVCVHASPPPSPNIVIAP